MQFKSRQKPTLLAQAQNLIWPRAGWRRAALYLWYRVTRISATPHVIALGFAAGAFASFTPFIGFHFIIAGLLALVVGGNVLASALGTGLGNPLTFPFIWYATFGVGNWLLGHGHRGHVDLTLPEGVLTAMFTDPGRFWDMFWGELSQLIVPMCIGSVPLGLAAGLFCYAVVRPMVRGYQHRRQVKLRQRLEGRVRG